MGGRIKQPSHTTVVAYAALTLAIGTGGAYALDKVNSHDIRDGSIRSADLRDEKGVRARDVATNTLGGGEIDEASLDASHFMRLAGYSDAGSCDPTPGALATCLSSKVELSRSSRLFVVATGNQFTADGDSDGSQADCQIQVDGVDRGLSASSGELGTSTHRSGSPNGFARTLVTPEPVSAGAHEVSLACAEVLPDVRIGTPTLAVLAVSAG